VATQEAANWADENPDLYPHGRPKWGRPETLKAIKEEWYFLKTFVAFLEKEKPRTLREAFKDVGWLLFGARPAEKPHWGGAFVFKCASRKAKEIAASPLFNGFIAVVDAVYLSETLDEYSKQPKDKRDVFPVISATMSFMNSTASTLAAELMQRGTKKLRPDWVDSMAEELGLDGVPMERIPLKKLTRAEAVKRLKMLANSPEGIQVLGKVFGFVGALVGGYSARKHASEAGARGDTAAAWGYRVVAGANFAAAVGYALGGAGIVIGAMIGSMVGLPATLALGGLLLVTGGSGVSLLGSVVMPLLEHDPLEIWLLHSPWGRERDQDSDNIALQFTKYYRALAGLKIECVKSMLKDHFVLTVQSRLACTPEEVWVGYVYVSEAGGFRRPFGPLTASDCKGVEPNTYELKVFCDNPKLVDAQVQIRANRKGIPPYPEDPETPSFPLMG
jgi:hypothetical protein